MFRFELFKASVIESLNLLKLDSIKLLALASLNSLFFLYRSLLYAWFLPLALLVGLVLDAQTLVVAFYLTVLVKAARPSMELKRSAYWQKPLFADWILFIAVLLVLQVPRFFGAGYEFLLKLFFLAGHSWLPGTEALSSVLVFLSPFLLVWTLFMLDARTNLSSYVKSFGRALVMFIFNYPFFLVSYAVFIIGLSLCYLIEASLANVIPQVSYLGWFIVLGAIIPYWVCFITNFYVKRLHEQFSLYYRN